MTNPIDGRLPVLVGQRLYAVEFVLDYVILKFDNEWGGEFPTLHCFSLPCVVRGSKHTPGDAFWERTLLSLIGDEVISTSEAAGSGLSIALRGGTVLINPTPDEVGGPEIAMLRDGDKSTVWRPGEDSFANLAIRIGEDGHRSVRKALD